MLPFIPSCDPYQFYTLLHVAQRHSLAVLAGFCPPSLISAPCAFVIGGPMSDMVTLLFLTCDATTSALRSKVDLALCVSRHYLQKMTNDV